MGDHTITLTAEQEEVLEQERLCGTFATIPESLVMGEPSPNPEPVSGDEFVQAVIDKYLKAKQCMRARRALKNLTPEEVELILERRAEEEEEEEPDPD